MAVKQGLSSALLEGIGNSTVSRRHLLLSGVGLVGASLLGRLPAVAAPPLIARYPLRIPGAVTPAGLQLTCAPATVDLGGNLPISLLAYNGQFPGPTIIAEAGTTATIQLVNGLSDDTITHWHGLVVDTPNDGGPQLHIPPGGVYNYSFPVKQRAGFNFYHPHTHMLTAEQVCLGLAGGFIVRDSVESALKLPSGKYEVPLVIRDATWNNQGQMIYNAPSSGFNGRDFLVNGTRYPQHYVDRGIYRFRILNAANARLFNLVLTNGAPFTIIGNDGGLLSSPATSAQILLGMAERLDVLVSFAGLQAGEKVWLRDLLTGWDLVEFEGTGIPGRIYTPPAHLSKIPTALGPATATRTFSFDGMSRINGLEFEMNRIDFQVPFGVTERWRFVTGGNAPHPVHVHGASFRVVARSGGRAQLFPWESGWKDTVLLMDNETVDVLIRFTDYRGRYVMHCHQLEHESMGMMSAFEVV